MTERQALRDKLAEFFRTRPNEWVNGLDLANIAGKYAWRTRVSDCRLQLGMTIKNRQHRLDGKVISEYAFVN